MTRLSPLAIGTLFAGTLLSSCSPSSSKPESVAGASVPPIVAERTKGTKADSLDGIPGHRFGEPLSAFPGVELAKTQHPGTQTYVYSKGKREAGWFGKHRQEVGFTFYDFRDGRFVSFQAIAFGTGRAALQQEAEYLFGPGRPGGLDSTWEGRKATAYTNNTRLELGPALILTVASVAHLQAKAQEEEARLKAENAQ